MSSFRLNNGFRLPENKHGYQSLEITSENTISLCATWQNTPRLLECFGSLVQGLLRTTRHFELKKAEKALRTRLRKIVSGVTWPGTTKIAKPCRVIILLCDVIMRYKDWWAVDHRKITVTWLKPAWETCNQCYERENVRKQNYTGLKVVGP